MLPSRGGLAKLAAVTKITELAKNELAQLVLVLLQRSWSRSCCHGEGVDRRDDLEAGESGETCDRHHREGDDGRQLYRCTRCDGTHVMSFQSNNECDVYIRKNLYVNVVLSRGMNGVQEVFERMTKELAASAPSAMKIKVVAPTNKIILTVGAKTLPLCGSFLPAEVQRALGR